MASELIGYQLGPYQITEFLGTYGVAENYTGLEAQTAKPVLIRLVGRDMEPDPVWSTRFRHDAKSIAALRHANIASAFDFGETQDAHYMVTDIVDGITLADLIAEVKAGKRALLPEDITFLVRQIAAALDHAHSKGVVHRSLSPGFVIVTRSGQAIITDFGLSILLSRGAAETSGGAAFGDPAYMAPEVIGDFRAATPASDIYSLGAILFEIVTGETPSAADSMIIATGDLSPENRLQNPAILPTVAEVVQTALNPSPRDRFKSAMLMAAQLEWAYSNPDPLKARPPKESARLTVNDTTAASSPTVGRLPTADRVVVKRGPSVQDERREKARLRAELHRIKQQEQAEERKRRQEEQAEVRALKQEEDRIKRVEQRRRTIAWWRQWWKAVAAVVVIVFLLIAGVFGLQAAGLLSITVGRPVTPSPEGIPTENVAFVTENVTQATEAVPTVTPRDLSTPTPLALDTSTPISPVEFTPLTVGTSAFRIADGGVSQFVPAGQFLMGTDDFFRLQNVQPQHAVMLADYWIDRTEVTNAQYNICVESGRCNPPTNIVYSSVPTFANFPVTFVDYERAASYCLWLASETGAIVGLPTEAQWEKAAAWDPNTGQPRPYPWGDAPASVELFRFNEGQDSRPASPVGSYPLGASAYGAQDMAGNVWEWTADWYDADYYKRTGVQVDPLGPTTGNERVTRGGSWRVEARLALSTVRNPARPDVNGDSLGFRCAMTGNRPAEGNGIFLTPLDVTAGLANLVQQMPADSGNDSAVLADWLVALGNLQQSLKTGTKAQSLATIGERAQVIQSQRRDELLTAALAWQLERALIWLQIELSVEESGADTTGTPAATQIPLTTPATTPAP